jgi:hypothetical protein
MSTTGDRGSERQEPARRFARPYALTGGRTRSKAKTLTLETLVVATDLGRATAPTLPLEQRRILEEASEAISIVELSARLRLPLGVARVLASDMRADDLVSAHRPPDAEDDLTTFLERIRDGLRAL